jgi:DNA-binding transcriptional LysR family regulator
VGEGVRPRTRSAGWLRKGVELRHFAALEAVAEGASFSRAARALGYTQSAVSQQIAALERIVGQKLVHRPGGQRAVSLTDAGAMLLEHARAIGSRLAAAEADIDALAEGARGTLRVGSFQAAGARILPEVLRRFLAEAPDVRLELTESVTDLELVGRVERGELDLAFAIEPLAGGPFRAEPLLRDPFFLILPAGTTLDELAGPARDGTLHLPVVCFRTCAATRDVLNFLRDRGVEPEVVLASDQNETLHGAVAAGLGAGVLPRLALALDFAHPVTEWLSLGPDAPARQVSLVWHANRTLPASARVFLDAARAVSAELDAEATGETGPETAPFVTQNTG